MVKMFTKTSEKIKRCTFHKGCKYLKKRQNLPAACETKAPCKENISFSKKFLENICFSISKFPQKRNLMKFCIFTKIENGILVSTLVEPL